MRATRCNYLLFDLGNTLMHARGDWEEIHSRGDQALTQDLSRYNVNLDSRIFRERLHAYYLQRDKDYQETTYHFVLDELLSEMGYGEVPDTIVRSALDSMYSITQTNWMVESDTLETISQLHVLGYRLGILSNAGDDQDVQQLVRGFGLDLFFDFILTSAKCFYRKPHPRAFELALAHWNAPPQEAVMIGDSLEADIQGAQNSKLRNVWIKRRALYSEEQLQKIHPEFTIQQLTELPAILANLTVIRQ
ncbi:MAG: HAD family hydrolase [Chloroflexi bacterium]|nr:HAD family hydrolase [Chloroflexota bacterium]